jgi:hypothetical protein
VNNGRFSVLSVAYWLAVFSNTGFALLERGPPRKMVWRSGNFEFCSSVFALVNIEVLAALWFTFCILRRDPTRGVQNSVVLRGARLRLLVNFSLDASRSRAILEGFMFIDLGKLLAISQTSGAVDAYLSVLGDTKLLYSITG